jgi:3-oxoacyl-[acyl-carrier protein] reductase
MRCVLAGRFVLVEGDDDPAREIAAGLTDLGANVATEFRRDPDILDALVYVPAIKAVVYEPIAEMNESTWDARGEALLRDALRCVQAGFRVMRERGGRIVLVTPTVGIVGADGLAPYAMAMEGLRTLAKAAARQWGSAGITVNCVAPSLDVFGIAQDVGGPVPLALGRVPDARHDVASVIAGLLGDAGSSVTGTTIVVDGGVVMAP